MKLSDGRKFTATFSEDGSIEIETEEEAVDEENWEGKVIKSMDGRIENGELYMEIKFKCGAYISFVPKSEDIGGIRKLYYTCRVNSEKDEENSEAESAGYSYIIPGSNVKPDFSLN